MQVLAWEHVDYVMCAGTSSKSKNRAKDPVPISVSHRPWLYHILRTNSLFSAANLKKTGSRQLKGIFFPGARGGVVELSAVTFAVRGVVPRHGSVLLRKGACKEKRPFVGY